jgi:hypothetical protein
MFKYQNYVDKNFYRRIQDEIVCGIDVRSILNCLNYYLTTNNIEISEEEYILLAKTCITCTEDMEVKRFLNNKIESKTKEHVNDFLQGKRYDFVEHVYNLRYE